MFITLLHSIWRTSSSVHSRPPEDFLSQFQSGGTATVICENWVSRIVGRGEDPLGLGRWSFFTLRGKGSRKVTIITAYNASPTTGDTTNFRQQQRVLTSLHHQYHQCTSAQPRRQFILNLQSLIESLIQDGHDIILVMDTKSTYDPDVSTKSHHLKYQPGVPTLDIKHNGHLSTLIATCGLLDPLAHQHSSRPFPPSHICGSERIDFILVFPGIMGTVCSSGCFPIHALFNSDNRACFIDINSTSLFAAPAYEIAPPYISSTLPSGS